eukprot:9453027-Ditylum_brightwellii.AAC.1
MEVGDIKERKKSTAWCKTAAAYPPTDVLRVIWDFHLASTRKLAWGKAMKELTCKKPILGRITFNIWYGM